MPFNPLQSARPPNTYSTLRRETAGSGGREKLLGRVEPQGKRGRNPSLVTITTPSGVPAPTHPGTTPHAQLGLNAPRCAPQALTAPLEPPPHQRPLNPDTGQ